MPLGGLGALRPGFGRWYLIVCFALLFKVDLNICLCDIILDAD